jgi:23S rRNA pseudouridine2457 synthase
MPHYFIVYKPYFVLSQFTSQLGKQTLADYFKVPKNVYPVGRLDHDSEGLLLLTNDAAVNHRLFNPKFEHEREYWVQVDGAITPEALQQLQRGVQINVAGKIYNTKPCHVSLLNMGAELPERNPPIRFRKEIPALWIKMILTEGKNRQVRKMTARVGFPALRLIRYRIGKIELGNMQPGDINSLSQQTVYKKLFNQ